jgi:hypothetical protein
MARTPERGGASVFQMTFNDSWSWLNVPVAPNSRVTMPTRVNLVPPPLASMFCRISWIASAASVPRAP